VNGSGSNDGGQQRRENINDTTGNGNNANDGTTAVVRGNNGAGGR